MSAPANDQSVNLKHRLTGAVILIGIAVGGASLLLDRGDTGPIVEQSPPEPSGESFVSRIVSAEQRTGQVPAPESPPLDGGPVADAERTGQPAAEPVVARTAPDRPEPAIQPVLTPHLRLPAPTPRLNTVEAPDPERTPAPQVAARAEPNVRAPAGEWVVRVASFAESDNAARIVERLEAGGFAPSSARVDVNGKPMVRVWVGPYTDLKDATRAKAELADRFDLDGFVVRQR